MPTSKNLLDVPKVLSVIFIPCFLVQEIYNVIYFSLILLHVRLYSSSSKLTSPFIYQLVILQINWILLFIISNKRSFWKNRIVQIRFDFFYVKHIKFYKASLKRVTTIHFDSLFQKTVVVAAEEMKKIF